MADLITSIKSMLADLEDPSVQSGDDAQDRVVALLNAVDLLKATSKELAQAAEQLAIQIIDERGEIVVGDIRYYVGPDKTTKPRDKGAILDALLVACDGDLSAIANEVLSSDPFKVGACRTRLGDEAIDKLFETTVKQDLKTGKPARGLHKVNAQFLPRKGQQ